MNIEEIKTTILLIIWLGTIVCTVWVTHRVEDDRYKAAQVQAVTDALNLQKQEDQETQKAAQMAAQHQQDINNDLRKRLNVVHKSVNNNCLSWGTIQLLDSYVLNKDPSSLPLPAGRSISSPSGISADNLVASILNNYGIAKLNAQRLSDFQNWWKDQSDLSKAHP